ncbi:NADP-reducing hydrogenase subunit HndC [Streptomyces sp. MBT84]|uniref:formate dehydrogenase beta subunit n=1 Tax=unclassified Streptomyces TaxID=2593676 RepID=UPI000740F095|nr:MULTISPECIES: NADH-quinone oxidoreductase subunit NuoF [unclassified Streptomyces]KUJ42350.1 formate dehydrogenase [Streptomyces sp. NRRL F-5122]MBW8699036.1 NADP-reducing hydrogenase subunit HndC [Streptomyces sp. MBT84]MDX3259503.1 NADH-quinone oxidoreductase subunit NuoF [Streptomyces sp. MI02-2A]REE65103.1 formate dehydrogenase beta subunit [Streptomyces sp. 3212.3]
MTQTSNSPVTVYVPRDSAARSVGADAVAEAIRRAADARNLPINLVRNGSRGMLWLEPLVEVATSEGRIGYGPVAPSDVADLLAADFLDGADHPLRLGVVDELPWLARQNRVTFTRVGIIDPISPEDYERHGGLVGLRRALDLSPSDVVAAVTESGLRGRGGAGFPAGIKWKTVLDCADTLKFVCCNADEGDSGTFADRMVMEGDPFMLIEGMTIAAHAVGAREGYVYIRSEYPDAVATMRAAIAIARDRHWLGERILGSDLTFDLHVRVGAGAYICGEETSMLESLEGKRGVVRAKPPIPAIEGLFGKPTVVNNVLTLATVPVILADGAKAYQELGVERSRGTQVFQLGGNIAHGGIVETAFGVTLRELIEDYGGGTLSGRPVRTVQVGGPLGAYLPTSQFDLPMDYEAFAAAGAMLGHGGVVVFDDTVDMAAQARFAMEFCAAESCGKCTPCRVGSVRGVEVIDRIVAGEQRDENLALLEDLCELMTDGSLCAMGGLTPMPVRSAVTHFSDDFLARGEGTA